MDDKLSLKLLIRIKRGFECLCRGGESNPGVYESCSI
jgi:hypothetical protein